ncbi:hypothetical protein L6164_018065 [Bauhinia variegata]|uniref:Uncharacterized protein n=1 Tax=Bauhinia variegata TaxID=167791 RepID=A0ACB9NAJ9_BAUVA|nr:hypothetical protein L6164_018065 [Bauhinia variegata]
MKPSCVVAALLVLLVLLASSSEARRKHPCPNAISCDDVLNYLKPCLPYLKGQAGKPGTVCCSGASSLKAAASTTEDKRAACDCIKTAAQSIQPNPQAAQSLPQNCGISFPYTISPNIDCSK